MTHCRQVMLEELQRRNFAPTTISSYLHAVEQFARHFRWGLSLPLLKFSGGSGEFYATFSAAFPSPSC